MTWRFSIFPEKMTIKHQHASRSSRLRTPPRARMRVATRGLDMALVALRLSGRPGPACPNFASPKPTRVTPGRRFLKDSSSRRLTPRQSFSSDQPSAFPDPDSVAVTDGEEGGDGFWLTRVLKTIFGRSAKKEEELKEKKEKEK